MSRRRELGIGAGWTDAFGVLRSPSLGAIILLGLVLTVIFLFWMVTAYAIYELTSVRCRLHSTASLHPQRSA